MNDEHKCYQATPNATLEAQIINPSIPKSEREWWAYHEILTQRRTVEVQAHRIKELEIQLRNTETNLHGNRKLYRDAFKRKLDLEAEVVHWKDEAKWAAMLYLVSSSGVPSNTDYDRAKRIVDAL